MKKALLTLLVLGFAQISVAAQPTVAKAAGQLLKKTFSGTMTGLHWGIAAGLPITIGTFSAGLLSNKITFLPDADHQPTHFIATELLQQGVKIDAVKIVRSPDAVPPAILPIQPNMIVSSVTEKEITAAIESDDKLTQQKYKSMLEYSAQQIKHNDLHWICAAGFAMPFITHTATKALYNNLAYAKKAKPFLLQQCAKIPTGFGKLALSLAAIKGVTMYQEQRNDNEMTNDVDTLTGLKTYLAGIDKLTNLPYPLSTVKKRIEKLDQRIAELEKTQKDVSNNS
jgi:hypothetical protein